MGLNRIVGDGFSGLVFVLLVLAVVGSQWVLVWRLGLFGVAFCGFCCLVVLCCVGCVFWVGGFAILVVLVCGRFARMRVFSGAGL